MVGADSMTTIQTPDHHGDHRHFLWSSDDPQEGRVDAIIVPTVRPATRLVYAGQIADQLACPLLTLHSGRWTSAREVIRRIPRSVELIAIDVPALATLRLPDFETSRMLAHTKFAQRTDTSTKRNLALILSRLVGWNRIVFIDDDIMDVEPSDLRQAAGMLDTHDAVGLSIGGYPDNSVVCHAYRAVGGDQSSFIGGGALAVEISRNRSFFPDIYNDDWLFLLDARKGLQPLGVAGRVIQQAYDPFRTPLRARTEEFGDVMAEGTFWLLDQGYLVTDADLSHWAGFLARRRRFIEHVLTLIQKTNTIEPGERNRMAVALRSSLGRSAHIKPELCRDYLRALARDQERWQQHIDRFRSRKPIDMAIRSLSKPGAPPLSWVVRRPEARTCPRS
jgi:hypothetical protein